MNKMLILKKDLHILIVGICENRINTSIVFLLKLLWYLPTLPLALLLPLLLPLLPTIPLTCVSLLCEVLLDLPLLCVPDGFGVEDLVLVGSSRLNLHNSTEEFTLIEIVYGCLCIFWLIELNERITFGPS